MIGQLETFCCWFDTVAMLAAPCHPEPLTNRATGRCAEPKSAEETGLAEGA